MIWWRASLDLWLNVSWLCYYNEECLWPIGPMYVELQFTCKINCLIRSLVQFPPIKSYIPRVLIITSSEVLIALSFSAWEHMSTTKVNHLPLSVYSLVMLHNIKDTCVCNSQGERFSLVSMYNFIKELFPLSKIKPPPS